jgi:LPS sulfotransferase NodH
MADETMNPLLSCFPAHDPADSTRYIDHFDWGSSGVEIPYVIFFTGRCGSTLLTHLLRDSGLCGSPEEFFNESQVPQFNKEIGAADFPQYFRAVVAKYRSNARFGCEVDPIRFNRLRELLDFSKVFPIGVTKLFWMTRRDILGQAWSYAAAKESGLWHEYADGTQARVAIQGDTPSNSAVIIDDHRWWSELTLILRTEQLMEAFFRVTDLKPYRFDYELLISDRYRTVIMFLQRLGCSGADIEDFLPRMRDQTRRQAYESRHAQILRFSEKYSAELEHIERSRFNIDLSELKQALLLRHGIAV